MKYWASIVAAAAIMALGAPTAFGAGMSQASVGTVGPTQSLGAGKVAPPINLGILPQWV